MAGDGTFAFQYGLCVCDGVQLVVLLILNDPPYGSERLFNGLVEGDVDLGNENVGIRGVVQDVGEPFQVHRALVGRLLVIHAGSGPDRIAGAAADGRREPAGRGVGHPW